MGTRVYEKKNKYRLYSTVSDQYWHDGWATRLEAAAMLVGKEEHDHKMRVIEIVLGFPNGYYNSGRAINAPAAEEGRKAWSDFLSASDYGGNQEVVEKVYQECMKKIEEFR